MTVMFKTVSLLLAVAVLLTGCDLSGSFSEVERRMTGLPSPKKETVIVEHDQLTLPTDTENEPWDVGESPRLRQTYPVQLGKILPKKYSIWGGAISEQSGKAILTYMDKSDREKKDTFAIACDVNRGKALARWKVSDFLAPYAIHPDGRTAIFCRQDGVLSERETLYLATRNGDSNIPNMEIWRPLVDPAVDKIKLYQEEWEIIWASFVGEDRIVTLNNAGKIHVWDLNDLSRLAVFPGVKGIPAVTPDGSKVAFLTDDMVALLDPSQPTITNVHRVGELPKKPLLSFHPDGYLLAIAGKGKSIVLDLEELKQSQAMIDRLSTSQSMSLMPDFAWAGYYLYKSRQLYTFDSPIPVWRITGTQWEMPQGRSIWAVVRGINSYKSKKRDIVFRSFNLPTEQIEQKVEEIYKTTDVIALRVGDPVRIDVSRIPSERQDQVRDALKQRLKEEGYRPSQRAEVTLQASLDEPKRTDVKYSKMWSGKVTWTYEYEIQNARMEFKKGGKKLWSATAYRSPPSSIPVDKLPHTEFVSKWGHPDYSLFSEHRMPAYLRGDRSGSVLGKTHLFASGMSE